MNILIAFLLQFLNAASLELPENYRYYYGVESDSPETYFAVNYMEMSPTTGKFLPFPLVFKMNQNQDTLFVLCNSRCESLPQIPCTTEFKMKNFPGTFILNSENRCVEFETCGQRVKLKNKSMI